MALVQSRGSSPPVSFHTASGRHSGSTDEPFVFQKPLFPSSHPQTSLGSPARFSHRREASNPFDVLYDGKAAAHGPSTPNPDAFRHNRQHQRVISDFSAIVTHIDKLGVSRSGSVVSRSASLRNRHKIIKRNKMVDRKTLELDSDSIYTSDHRTRPSPSPIRQKIKFLFPVRRKTSLKKAPKYRLLKNAKPKGNFSFRWELEQFLESCDAYSLVREMLPASMKVFNYLGIVMCNPILTGEPHHVEISGDNQFTLYKKEVGTTLDISAPIKETFTKNGYSEYQHHYEKSKFNLLDSIYNRYRAEVFAKKCTIPPKFSEVFPEELGRNLLTSKEIDSLNKKILLEVLLRRTLAAKIEYRLKTNGWKPTDSDNRRLSSNSNSSSNDDDASQYYRHSHAPRLVHTDSDTSSDNDSVDTDDIMQHNASLYSGLLPSPQISYKSDIFGSGFEFNASDFYAMSSEEIKLKDLPIKPKSDTNSTKLSSPELAFVNAFSRQLYQHKQEQKAANQGVLRTGFEYELKPMTRSTETFSSSNSEDYTRTPPLSISQTNSLRSQKRESRDTKSTSISSSDKRRSISSNVSIIHDLENLSSQLSNYLNDGQPNEIEAPFIHKNVIPSESDIMALLPKREVPSQTDLTKVSQEPLSIVTPSM